MLEVKNLVKKFGDKTVVNNVSFDVGDGKIFGFLGRNGAGKSTIFRIILNILEATSGTILYNGKNVNSNMDDIGYLPEEGSLMLNYTVLDQCIYYGTLKGMSENLVEKELLRWLKKFDIVEYMNMKIKDLSKGNRQKIQFIISVLHNPKLLILDEPFSGLDPLSVEQFKDIILELKDMGKIIVFSSHRMEHVEMLCEDIIILEKGNVILNGNLNDIKSSYKNKRITINGNISDPKLKYIENISGVDSVVLSEDGKYIINLEDNKYIREVLDVLRDCEISDFSTSQITLNDIFINKVGKNYEE